MSDNDSSTDKFTVRFELDKSRLVDDFKTIRSLVSDTFRTPAALASQMGGTGTGTGAERGSRDPDIYITGTAADQTQVQQMGRGKYFITVGGGAKGGTQYGELLEDEKEKATQPTKDELFGYSKDPRVRQPETSPFFGGAVHGLPPGEHSQIRDILDWIEDVRHSRQGTLKHLAKSEGGVMQKGEPGSITEYRMDGIIRAVTRVQEIAELLIKRGLIQETDILSEVKSLKFGEEGDYARLSTVSKMLGNTVEALTNASFTGQRGFSLETAMKEITNDVMRLFVGGSGEGASHIVGKNVSEHILQTLGFGKFSTESGMGDIRREFSIDDEPGKIDIGVLSSSVDDYFRGGVFKHMLMEHKSERAGTLDDARQLTTYMGSSIPKFLSGLKEIMEREDDPDMSRIAAKIGLSATDIKPTDPFVKLMKREWIKLIRDARATGHEEQLDLMGWDETTLDDYIEFVPLKGITKPDDMLKVLTQTSDITPSNIINELTKIAIGRLQPGSRELALQQPKYNPGKPLSRNESRINRNRRAREKRDATFKPFGSEEKKLVRADLREFLAGAPDPLPDAPVQAPLIASAPTPVVMDHGNKRIFEAARWRDIHHPPGWETMDRFKKVEEIQEHLTHSLKLPPHIALLKALEYIDAKDRSDEEFAKWYKDQTGDSSFDSTQSPSTPRVTQPERTRRPPHIVTATLTTPEPIKQTRLKQLPINEPTRAAQKRMEQSKKSKLFDYLSRMGPGDRSPEQVERERWDHPFYWIGYIRKGESAAQSGIGGDVKQRKHELGLVSHRELQMVNQFLGMSKGGSKEDLQNRIINSYNKGTRDYVPLPDLYGEIEQRNINQALRSMIAMAGAPKGDESLYDKISRNKYNFHALGRGTFLRNKETYEFYRRNFIVESGMVGQEGWDSFGRFGTKADEQMNALMESLSGEEPEKLPFTSVNQTGDIFKRWRGILEKDDVFDTLDDIDALKRTIKTQTGGGRARLNLFKTMRDAKVEVFDKMRRETDPEGNLLHASLSSVSQTRRAKALYDTLKGSPAQMLKFLAVTQEMVGMSGDVGLKDTVWDGVASNYSEANEILKKLKEVVDKEEDSALADVFNNMRQLFDKELNLQVATSVGVWYGLGNGT